MTDPYLVGLVPPKTLSVGFVGVPPDSVIQSAIGTLPNLTIRHGAFGTNPRWIDLGDGTYAFLVDQYINALQMFWIVEPSGRSYVMVGDPYNAPRALCSPATMLLDRSAILRNAIVHPSWKE